MISETILLPFNIASCITFYFVLNVELIFWTKHYKNNVKTCQYNCQRQTGSFFLFDMRSFICSFPCERDFTKLTFPCRSCTWTILCIEPFSFHHATTHFCFYLHLLPNSSFLFFAFSFYVYGLFLELNVLFKTSMRICFLIVLGIIWNI